MRTRLMGNEVQNEFDRTDLSMNAAMEVEFVPFVAQPESIKKDNATVARSTYNRGTDGCCFGRATLVGSVSVWSRFLSPVEGPEAKLIHEALVSDFGQRYYVFVSARRNLFQV